MPGNKYGPLPPIARNSDLATSHEAAREITESGKRLTLMWLLLEIVQDVPGQTAGEYGVLIVERSSRYADAGVWKRLADLKNKGLLRQGEPRVWDTGPGATHRKQCTWWPVKEKQLSLFEKI